MMQLLDCGDNLEKWGAGQAYINKFKGKNWKLPLNDINLLWRRTFSIKKNGMVNFNSTRNSA